MKTNYARLTSARAFRTLAGGIAIATATVMAFPTAASAQSGKVVYNCQNGPPMTVVYASDGRSLRYVYDGPDSAMRTMVARKGSKSHFKDGQNSIRLKSGRRSVEYREGGDLFDRCKSSR